MIPRFAVYLFDIDGTLLDSARDICAAVQDVIVAHGASEREFAYLKSFVGLHLIDLFQDVFPSMEKAQVDALIQQYRSNYLGRCHRETRPFPGAQEALAALGGRKSTATTKGTPTTRAVLTQFGLIQYFDHVQGTDGIPYKPAPDVLQAAMAALGAHPEECLMVGDSVADVAAGRAAGVKTCAVRYGYGNQQEMARLEPDYWVDDLRALIAP
ncbi:MAG TPA: HAD-IA family hydrolase [Bryobacteraceae bacterium]|nr:HAD-IA family hydrolase [Bryobacteraceae bacterium]